jgi:hypothetical protein
MYDIDHFGLFDAFAYKINRQIILSSVIKFIAACRSICIVKAFFSDLYHEVKTREKGGIYM